VLSRLGPAPIPLACAVLVVLIAAFGALVPIGRPSRTLETAQALGMVLGAGALAAWAVAVGLSAWNLSRQDGTVLVPSMSPGVFDFLFSVPFLVLVPVAGGGIFALLRGRPSFATLSCALFWLGLCALREADRVTSVDAQGVRTRAGYLWVRRESAPLGAVKGVEVLRDSYRGAPSYVVKLSMLVPGRYPRLEAAERRYRVEAEAEAEAARWRSALGQLGGGP